MMSALLSHRSAERLRDALRRHGWGRLTLGNECPDLPVEQMERWLLDFSAEIGFVVPQSHSGKLVARICDEGRDYSLHTTRGHQTNSELAFHSDRCDVNLLFYLRTAAEGGGVSVLPYEAAAKRLEVLDRHALEALFTPFPVDLREERIFAQPEWHCRPILWRTSQGGLRGHYIRRFIEDSQRHDDCPRLTETQRHALDAWDAVLAEIGAACCFVPDASDLLALDNYRVMHSRTRFVDDVQSPRLALRTWIAPYESEALPSFLMPLTGSCEAGAYRGGIGKGADYFARLGYKRPAFSEQT